MWLRREFEPSPSGLDRDAPAPGGLVCGLRHVGHGFVQQTQRGAGVVEKTLPLGRERQLAGAAVDQARAAGIMHIVRSSGAGADPASPVSIARVQGEIDAMVAASGILHTFLHPSSFMQNWVTFSAAQVKAGAVYAPHGTAAYSVIDARDIADAAAAVLVNPAPHAGKACTLTGGKPSPMRKWWQRYPRPSVATLALSMYPSRLPSRR